MYKYKKFDVFINVVTAFIVAGLIKFKNTKTDGINKAKMAGPPISFKIGIFIPKSPSKIPIIIITAKPPIISGGNVL